METPLVAVVTLNWNGAAFLRECVDSILASDYKNYQVVIVDNGSTDNSLELLDDLYASSPLVHVLKNGENLGYSHGMNAGLAFGFGSLHADYCLVMNNDTKIDPHAISALVEVGEREDRVAFITGKVYYYDAPDIFQTVGKKSHPVLINGGHIGRKEKDLGQYNADTELAFCDDIFWLVTRQVYETIGGYDPEFFLQAEDFDWQLRAKKAGFRIMFAHKAMLWHKESMKLGKLSPKKAYYDVRNPMVAVMKNCEPELARRCVIHRIRCVVLPSIFINACKGRIVTSVAMARGLISILLWKFRFAGKN